MSLPLGEDLDAVHELVASAAVEVQRPGPYRPDHRYFCTSIAEADRLYDALRPLDREAVPTTVFFVDCAPEALTTMRARRLLAWGVGVGLVLLSGETTRAALARLPATLADVVARWAVRYATEQADAVVEGSGPLPHPREAPASAGRRNGRPGVSVVIPVFNQGAYLREAVDSARAQDIADLEVVVVDDGSTEALTQQVVAELDGVVTVSQENRGLSAARNAGIARARGEYVVPLDADDLLAPGFLPAAVEALERRPERGYVVGYAQYTGLLNHVYVPAGFVPEVSLFLHTDGKAVGVYRRSALDDVGGYDEDFEAFEDWELQVALHRAGHQSDVLPVLGQNYRRHAHSMSFSRSNGIRDRLIEQLVRKHVEALSVEELRVGLLVLSRFWKTGYEPSASVLLQRTASVRPAAGTVG